MPIGFICLGVFLIYQLLYQNNNTKKIGATLFCLFTMSGYLIGTITLKSVSINIIFMLSALFTALFAIKNFKLKEIVNLLALCVFVSCFYVVLTKINSDFITTLNPYPIIFVMLIISVAVIKNFKFVVAFNLISFLFISLCNLFVEKNLGFVNFASLELFDLVLLLLSILLVIKLIIIDLKQLKRDVIWKNLQFLC